MELDKLAYVLNLDGDLYRIATVGIPGPATTAPLTATAVPEPSGIGLLAVAMVLVGHRPARRQHV